MPVSIQLGKCIPAQLGNSIPTKLGMPVQTKLAPENYSQHGAGRTVAKARNSTAGDAPSVEPCTCLLRCQQSIAASVASRGTPMWTLGWPPTPVETSVAGSCPPAVATAACCCATLALALPALVRYDIAQHKKAYHNLVMRIRVGVRVRDKLPADNISNHISGQPLSSSGMTHHNTARHITFCANVSTVSAIALTQAGQTQ